MPRFQPEPDFLVRAFYYRESSMLRFHAKVSCWRQAWQTTPLCNLGEGSGVNEKAYRSWMCIICGWVYEEEFGSPEDGLPPGTRWEDVPFDWACPDCGASKDDFEMIEI
jgi:rubredoxin